jgi:hypothetical protein
VLLHKAVLAGAVLAGMVLAGAQLRRSLLTRWTGRWLGTWHQGCLIRHLRIGTGSSGWLAGSQIVTHATLHTRRQGEVMMMKAIVVWAGKMMLPGCIWKQHSSPSVACMLVAPAAWPLQRALVLVMAAVVWLRSCMQGHWHTLPAMHEPTQAPHLGAGGLEGPARLLQPRQVCSQVPQVQQGMLLANTAALPQQLSATLPGRRRQQRQPPLHAAWLQAAHFSGVVATGVGAVLAVAGVHLQVKV